MKAACLLKVRVALSDGRIVQMTARTLFCPLPFINPRTSLKDTESSTPSVSSHPRVSNQDVSPSSEGANWQSLVTLVDPAPDSKCCLVISDIRVDFPLPVVPTTGITSRKKAWSSSASFRSLSPGSKVKHPLIKEHSSSSLIPAPPRVWSIQFLSSSAENMNSSDATIFPANSSSIYYLYLGFHPPMETRSS